MSVFFSHLFGKAGNRDSLDGLSEINVAGTGVYTENPKSLDLQQHPSLTNGFGFSADKPMVPNLNGLLFEIWFELKNEGNWGKTIDSFFGMQKGTQIQWDSGAYLEAYRTQGLGQTLTARVIVNGQPKFDTFILENDTIYKFKLNVISNQDAKYYVDGGEYNNMLIGENNADYTVSQWHLNFQLDDSNGDGDPGLFRVHSSYVHDEWLDFKPKP